MRHLAKIFFGLVIITIIIACWGCHPSPLNRAYISITNQPPAEDEDAGGLGDLGGNSNKHNYQEVVMDVAGGEMLPERFLQFKDEQGRLRNIATARIKLDSAIARGDFEEIKKWQEVIQMLNYYGMTGYHPGGRTGFVPVEPATNKPVIMLGVVNNSSRAIKLSYPLQLAGIELGPGEQTSLTFPIPIGLNKVNYTEYELGKARTRPRQMNVYVSKDSKNLTIKDL